MPSEASETLERSTTAKTEVGNAQRIPVKVRDAVDDGIRFAKRTIKQGRYASEDAIAEVEHKIKQKPFQILLSAFVAGTVTGGLLMWFGAARRR
jgi:ElaB/YqjD/DUF883 family membrane-anchored ribosome-binding protein